MIHVIKHDMDPNSNINYSRKIGPVKELDQIKRVSSIGALGPLVILSTNLSFDVATITLDAIG